MTKSRPNDHYQFIPGWQPLSWQGLMSSYPDDIDHFWLVCLSGKQLSVLLSLVNMVVPWYWLWQIDKTDTSSQSALKDFKNNLERDLMAVLSIDDLIKTNLMLVAALTGESINRDNPAAYLTGTYDPTGIEPTLSAGNTARHTDLSAINTTIGTVKTAVDTTNSRLTTINTTIGTVKTSIDTGNTNQHTDITNLIAKLEEIKDVLEAADPDSLADELSDIATNLTAVATILGV